MNSRPPLTPLLCGEESAAFPPSVSARPLSARYQDWQFVDWLPQTKFQPPLLNNTLVERSTLLPMLTQSICTTPLTIISAPAGYGKTVLLADWYTRMGQGQVNPYTQSPRATHPPTVCWLSLDPNDNDLTFFWGAMIKALQPAQSMIDTERLNKLVHFDQPPSMSLMARIQSMVGVLINVIIATAALPLILVLDEWHHITEPAIHRLVDAFLERLPAQMHLVVATRCTPPLALGRLSSRGQLAEYHTTLLAFSATETACFLNERLELALAAPELQIVHQYTEGWAVGLRFVANALTPLSTLERTALFTQLGQNPALLAAHTHLYDYLLAETLNKQEPALRSFLLQTSILSELTPALCLALTGRAQTGELLATLYRQNLFLVQAPSPPVPFGQAPPSPIYRYHAMFADFLRHCLLVEEPEFLPELHQRAANAEVRLERKLVHTLAANAWERAALLLEEAGEGWLQQGLLDSLHNWLAVLPEAVLAAHPHLRYLLGVVKWQRRDCLAAAALLQQALNQFAAQGDREAEGQALIYLAGCKLFSGDIARALLLLEQANNAKLTAESEIQRLLLHLWLHLYANEPHWRQVEQALAAVLAAITRQPERLYLRTLHLTTSFILLSAEGALAGLEATYQRALAQVPLPDPWWQIYLDNGLAWTYWLQGRIEQARDHLAHGLATCQRIGAITHPAHVELILLQSSLYSMQREFTGAQQLTKATLLQVTVTPLWLACAYSLGRFYWEEGRIAEAHQVYAEIQGKTLATPTPTGQIYHLMLGGLLAMNAGRYVEAEQQLTAATTLESHVRSATLLHSPRLLLAYLYLHWKGAKPALKIFKPFLAHCQRQHTPGLLLQATTVAIPLLKLAIRQHIQTTFATAVLTLLEPVDNAASRLLPETGTTLSRRELAVLRLIMAGASNRVIAESLDITLPTVKSHITRLFQKLNVASRQEAISLAHALNLNAQ